MSVAMQLWMPSTHQSPTRCAGEGLNRRKRRSGAMAALSCRSGNASARGSGMVGNGEGGPVLVMSDKQSGGAVSTRRSVDSR